ncbi:hypothetical protein [Lactiplantibacillus plajomi]|uniref:LPXTG cell wall anchor domain-containing protein n=1 Tax=Lactiplantibacillus plajomi TaxID=1457217 RepID=A0ABV6K6Q6_9LACO|nr:hypothetical protein [Lactiplantibacillus plajomi]
MKKLTKIATEVATIAGFVSLTTAIPASAAATAPTTTATTRVMVREVKKPPILLPATGAATVSLAKLNQTGRSARYTQNDDTNPLKAGVIALGLLVIAAIANWSGFKRRSL